MGVTQSYHSQEDDVPSLSKPIPIQTPSSFLSASLLDKRSPATHSQSISTLYSLTRTQLSSVPDHFVQVVFRWTGRGRKVFLETWPLDESGPLVSGTTNRVEMQFSQTERDFITVLKLPPGKYKVCKNCELSISCALTLSFSIILKLMGFGGMQKTSRSSWTG